MHSIYGIWNLCYTCNWDAQCHLLYFRVNITTKTKSKAKYELMSSTFLEVNLSKDDHDENVNMHKVVTNCRLLRSIKYT